MYRILIVEDDPVIAGEVKRHLEEWGYEAERAEDFRDVMPRFAAFRPQLVLMDISLPFYNGYYWCSQIRRISRVPVIFLSSASDSMNIVMAMNMGGDDFITKPFDFGVLTAKVRAMLRRTYDFGGETNLMEHRGAVLNTDDGTLTYRGERMELTKNELRILRLLLENKGRAVSRSGIMMRLWETDSYVDDNTLTVNMTRLRRKLEAAGLEDFIATRKGVGYLVE